MLVFVRNEKGRPEAQKGCHDDLVMALAITYYIRTQQSMVVDKKQQEKEIKDAFGIEEDTSKEWEIQVI